MEKFSTEYFHKLANDLKFDLSDEEIEELKKDLEEVANFKGSRLEQWLLIYCKQNRLPYNRLIEEEKQWLIRIGSKSDFMKSHISRRGRT